MEVNDIEGSRPTIKREFDERDPLKVSDIFGAEKRSVKPQRTSYQNIDYNDVTG
jgi:hypothetical protein